MINPQLLDYIKKQLSLKVSREMITTNLKGAGWTEADVAEAFTAIIPLSAPAFTPAPSPVSPMVSSAVSPTISPMTPDTIQPQTNFPKGEMTRERPVNYSQPVQKSNKGKKIFFAFLFIILLGALGAGAYAYYSGAFVSLPGLVSGAIDSARSTTSASYDVTASIDFSGIQSMTSNIGQVLPGIGLTPSSKFIITTKGAYDVSDKKNIKSSAAISADFGTLSFAAETRILNGVLYGALTKAPVLGFLPMLTTYENKWFSIPFKSDSGQTLSNPIGSFSSINTSVTDKLTSEQKDHLYQMVRNAHFIKTTQRFSPETVGGELSYHFAFDLDRAGISAYLQSLKEYINTIGKNDSSLSAFDPTSLNKSLDNLKNFTGEIWIGRNDKLLHKIVLNFGIQPDMTKDEQVKVSVVGIMSNYNQPVSIVAPAESTPFADLISSMLGQAQAQGKEAQIKTDLANLRVQAELFYSKKNSYTGLCSSVDLKTTRGDIEKAGGTGFTCKDAAQSYAIGVKLSSTAGNWCVDSTGALKAATALPTGTVCPAK